MMSFQSFATVSVSAVKALRRVMPALLTRIETCPTLSATCLGQRKAIVTLRHIQRKALGLAAGLADLLGGLRDRVGIDVEQHHLRPLARIAGGDRPADAGTGARDDSDVVCEQCHDIFLPISFLSFMKG